MPNSRLVPGGPLVLDPLDIRQRPFIKEIVDEDLSGIAGAVYMFTTAGVRGFHDTDNCHRLNNDFHHAIRRAGLWPAYAKVTQVTGLNKGPWLGGDNLEKKAESMVGML